MYQPFDLKPVLGREGDVRLTTTTLLPSGAVLDVLVRRDADNSYSVSDDGGACADLIALGYGVLGGSEKRRARDIADRFGLIFTGEAFLLHEISEDQLAGAIIYIAEASRQWASEVLSIGHSRKEKDLADFVEQRLRTLIPAAEITREREVLGASSKRHRFDFVIDLSGDRHAVIELVSPHPNSIAASHLKLFDVKEGQPDWLREVVTERLADWAPGDVALLNRVASHVRDRESNWSDFVKLAA